MFRYISYTVNGPLLKLWSIMDPRASVGYLLQKKSLDCRTTFDPCACYSISSCFILKIHLFKYFLMLNVGPPTVSFHDTTSPHFLFKKRHLQTTRIHLGLLCPWKKNRIKRGLNVEDKCNSSFNERQPSAYIQGCIRGHAFYLLKCWEWKKKKKEQSKEQTNPHRFNTM